MSDNDLMVDEFDQGSSPRAPLSSDTKESAKWVSRCTDLTDVGDEKSLRAKLPYLFIDTDCKQPDVGEE